MSKLNPKKYSISKSNNVLLIGLLLVSAIKILLLVKPMHSISVLWVMVPIWSVLMEVSGQIPIINSIIKLK